MGSSYMRSRKARAKGLLKKRRRKRAERREVTKEIREAHNQKMRELGHPGWVEPYEPLAWIW